MSSIQRYVVWEVLKVFTVVVAASTLMMVLGGGVKEGLKQGLPAPLIVEILPYMLPEMLRFTIPGCLLFAVCSVFGRMSGSNEVVALKSLGIGPLAVVWPVLAVSVVLSLGTFALYELCAVWGRPNLRRIVIESVEQIAYGVLRAERSFNSNQFSINVKGIDGRRLLHPIIVLKARGRCPAITMTAEEAELQTDEDSRALRILCRNGQVDMAGRGKLSFPNTHEQVIPFSQPSTANPNNLSPAALGTGTIPSQIAWERAHLKRLRKDLADEAGEDEAGTLSKRRELQHRRLRLLRLQTEPGRRRSNGFSCLCFALIGVAVAMRSRTTDTVTTFFICFLPILLLYYPLLVVGEYVSTKGLLPPQAVWLPNVVLAGLAVVLLRRVNRY